MKLLKGQSYIQAIETPDGKKYFFVIHQIGERSWTAMLFSHVVHNHNEPEVMAFISGNSTTLVDLVLSQNNANYLETRGYTKQMQAQMRIDMSNIFLRGEF